MKILLFALILLFPCAAWTAEVDQFTDRYKWLDDSSELINNKAADFLTEALERANTEDHGCQEKKLYPHLRKYFKNHMTGKLTPWVIKSELVPKRSFSRSESIYSEWKITNGYLLGKKVARRVWWETVLGLF